MDSLSSSSSNSSSLDPTAAVLASLSVDAFNALVATKYFAAAGLVCVLYDHLITIDSEVSVIWRGECTRLTKLVYMLNRYVMEAMLIYVAYIFAGLRPAISEQACKNFIAITSISSIIWSMLANMYIVFRLYGIWDHRKVAVKTIIGSFLVCYIPFVILGAISTKEYYENIVYAHDLNVCFVREQPKSTIGAWVCTLAFDVFTITHAVANSLDQPRRQNSELLQSLRRDGAIFFVALASLRLINLIISIVLPPSEIWVVIFLLWASIAITLTRLILQVESLKATRGGISTWVPAQNSFEMGRWSISSYQ